MLYILSGNDQFRKEIRAQELADGKEPVKISQASLQDLGRELTSLSLFKTQISDVYIKECDLFNKSLSEQEQKHFLELFSQDFSDRLVIIELKKTLKHVKDLKKLKNIQFEEINTFTSWQQDKAIDFLDRQSRRLLPKHRFELSALELLVDKLGADNLAQIFQELNRLSLTEKHITAELVEKECFSRYNLANLAEALAKKDLKKAYTEFKYLKSDKSQTNNLACLSYLHSYLQKQRKLILLLQSNLKDEDIAAQLKMRNPKGLYYKRKEVKEYDYQHLNLLQTTLLELEHKIKTGKLTMLAGIESLCQHCR
jgi:hypothetical protein